VEEVKAASIEGITIFYKWHPTESLCDERAIFVNEKPRLGVARAGREGPSNWAQWPIGEELCDKHFFGQAGDKFRRELRKRLKWPARRARAIDQLAHQVAITAPRIEPMSPDRSELIISKGQSADTKRRNTRGCQRRKADPPPCRIPPYTESGSIPIFKPSALR
jgi:hypothetical protein